MPSELHEPAPAKLNLYLRVVGRRADGYHLLDSLVAFTALGDELTVAPADELSLTIDGPFAASLGDSLQPDTGRNLVIRAAQRLRDTSGRRDGASIRLRKNLPVAAGIGGGSADAAAALRVLRALWALSLTDGELAAIGAALGADVPACILSRPALMRGIGDRLVRLGTLPSASVVLANPGQALETRSVFAARIGPYSSPAPLGPNDLAQAGTVRQLARMLEPLGNDLAEPAVRAVPAIADVLARLAAAPGCLLSRMSGSGPTCFGLFEDAGLAHRAAAAIGAEQPSWWVAATSLRESAPSVAPARAAP